MLLSMAKLYGFNKAGLNVAKYCPEGPTGIQLGNRYEKTTGSQFPQQSCITKLLRHKPFSWVQIVVMFFDKNQTV
jgi:hypothetical protein